MARGNNRVYPPKAIILHQGDQLAHTYLIIIGRAQAVIYSAGGQVILVHEFGPGDLFGAIGEAEPVQQEAEVLAAAEVHAFIVEALQLAALAQQHGSIGLALSRKLMQRLRETTSRMYERAALSAAGRVYAELLRQGSGQSGFRITPAPVIADLAFRASTTRETASRAISALQRRGIIRRAEESLTIVAPARLEELIF